MLWDESEGWEGSWANPQWAPLQAKVLPRCCGCGLLPVGYDLGTAKSSFCHSSLLCVCVSGGGGGRRERDREREKASCWPSSGKNMIEESGEMGAEGTCRSDTCWHPRGGCGDAEMWVRSSRLPYQTPLRSQCLQL